MCVSQRENSSASCAVRLIGTRWVELICLIWVGICEVLYVLPSSMNHRSLVCQYCLKPDSPHCPFSFSSCPPLSRHLFTCSSTPSPLSFQSSPPTIFHIFLLSSCPHPQSVPSIFSLPNNILSFESCTSFYSSTHLLLPRGNLYFWPVVSICHVHTFAISWSSGDNSRSLYPKSCYGQTRGTGHGGAACWRQSPGLSCTADVGGSRRRGRTRPCCMSGTYWWFPSGGWCPQKVEVQPTWRCVSRNMTKQGTFRSTVPLELFLMLLLWLGETETGAEPVTAQRLWETLRTISLSELKNGKAGIFDEINQITF